MELIGPIIEVFRCCGGPTCRYIHHHRKLGEHMIELRRNFDALKSREQDVESKTKEEEFRCEKVVKKEVENWFKDVQRVKNDMQEIEMKFGDVSYFPRGCLGKLIYRKIEEVKEIFERGNFLDGVAIDGPAIGKTLPITNLEGNCLVRERIWEYLMGDEVGMIGVCGMGGIGKTTIMKHIHNRLVEEISKMAEESKKFHHVIWVTVSKDLNISNLQQVIADSLKLESFPKDEQQRTGRLKDILERKRYVLILDDVWEQFSLLDVGILEPTLSVGRKIVLTSRSIDVCKSMDCKVVKVQLLSKDESMKLFLDHVGHNVVQDQNLEDIVNNIVEQCGNLPLSIVTIAGSMKGVDDICEWRNALNELKMHVKSVKGSDNKIFECLKFSYYRLEDPKIQNCFLYCSLYPEDFVIIKEELIESWIDEGLLEGLETRQAMHDKGYSILKKLENNCLLEKGTNPFGNKEGVKMHDVLRDMSLYIKGNHFLVKADKRKEVPSEQEWAMNVEMVSLMKNRRLEILLNKSPKCPHLSTLILKDCNIRSIPESFFEHMLELKVLDLSGNYKIMDLPNSISNLVNLNALRLQGCRWLKYVPSLAKLKALRKLGLGGTAIEEVPHGIEKLENLKYLDLRSRALKELPIGTLPMIPHIQCLMLLGVYVMGEELGKFRKLEYARCSFGDMLEFEKYAESVQGKWPINFIFRVGSFGNYSNEDVNFTEVEKALCFGRCKMERCDEIMVPHDLHYLSIDDCIGDLKCLTKLLLFRKASELKRCCIRWCSGIECAVDVSSSSCKALHTIEELELSELDNLQEIVRGIVRVELESTSHAPSPLPVFFSSLKTLRLWGCPQVKKLFPVELLQGLQNLERIHVRYCSEMEEVIASEENHKGEGTTSILPKLKSLTLSNLPKLKSICDGGVVIPANHLEYLHIFLCPEVKRMPLCLPLDENGQPSPPLSLQYIFVGSGEWWESVEWDQPHAKHLLSPFVRYIGER